MGGRAPDQKVNRKKTLRFLTLNVCGPKSKLLLPEFHSLISEFDIIGLQELKTDSLDTLNIPSYKLFCKYRKDFAKRKSGGIIVAYKEWLDKYIMYIESESKCCGLKIQTVSRNVAMFYAV